MIVELPRTEDNDLLLKKTEAFNFDAPQVDLKELYVNMVETMKENKGLGLAANQIRVPYSIFVMESVIPIMMINPEITSKSEETESYEEGCLSYPGLYVNLKRHKTIEIRYYDINGDLNYETYSGLSARVIQHEMEHLAGLTFYHSASRYHKQKSFKKRVDT